MSKKKLKIIIASGIFPADIGGPATFVQSLSVALPDHGCEVEVVSYGTEEEKEKLETFDKFKVRIINKTDNIVVRYINYFKKVWEISKAGDIIYAFDLISVGLPCALVKLFRPKVKLMVRLGGDYQWEQAVQQGKSKSILEEYYKNKKFSINESLIYFLNNLVLRIADKIIFNAEFLKNIYVKFRGVKEKKTGIIKNIKPDIIISENSRKSENINILFAGRLIKVRNLYRLIDAFEKLNKNISKKQINLEIIGEGPEKKNIIKYIKNKNLENIIKISDGLDRLELIKKINKSDVIVHPSLTEVNSNFIIESLLLKRSVVITKYTELHYMNLQSDLIYYVDPLDVDDIKEKMEEALVKREEKNKKVSLEAVCWNLDRVIDKHLEIFYEKSN